ncbi:alpha/beta fold hydrolase [Halalkalicoccus jeotgali]|uniref:Predicted hydrolase or acyltransferase (Alpha/beta hydrolase superfamily) protein n=1 Tax=Halalkalicoccus jeotgali (strain DSM 18796 / CECT 7217 / JCM 14584 / KCTC 4019 / B3) TaxID=795797 RepID=D8J2A5_HALJB|nr:alpha/beta hydrolase [Halalkalicoccus jeotgali]ADJ14862.1 predicted hydrolase or acyltransferase (alpha/beta hydrolase superfamily) protein [Halalkalicoccus jeotgali B3]ELY39444.1 putative hydrolase or acyltransferase (alpha/beta hydrolase superfamily) protein [Halalkalicoccus jeotgali B3]
METVSHHGRETAYEHRDRGGGGRGILCIHGSGGSRDVWKSQARLADDRPVIALDLSGHGESGDIASEAGFSTLSAYADDVIAVARETDARVLVGNSLGGAVALHIALYREFDPEALVLVGTGARLAVLEDLLAWLAEDFERAIDFLHEPGHLFYDADDALVALSRGAMDECGRRVVERDFRSCHTFDVRDDLDGIAVPTLAVCGEHDRLTPPAYHEYLAEEIPDGEFETIPEAAHLAMLERPGAFNERVSAFLTDRDQ